MVNAIDVAPTITFPTASAGAGPERQGSGVYGSARATTPPRERGRSPAGPTLPCSVVASTGPRELPGGPDLRPADADTDNDSRGRRLSVTTTAGVDTQARGGAGRQAAPTRPSASIPPIGPDPLRPLASFTLIMP